MEIRGWKDLINSILKSSLEDCSFSEPYEITKLLSSRNSPGRSKMERFNFGGKAVIGSAMDDKSASGTLELENDGNGNFKAVGGYCLKVTQELQFLFNFSLEIFISDSYIREENGTLKGIGGEVLEGNADFAMALSYFLPFRTQHLSALHPLVREPLLAIFSQPSSTSVRDIYLTTFSTPVWTSLLLLFLLIHTIHISMIWISFWFQVSPNIVDDNDSFLLLVASICEQGWHKRYKTSHFTILLFSSISFGYIITESFRATIITELSFKRILIKDFNDLHVHQFKILTDPDQQWGKYIVPPNTDAEKYLKEINSYWINEEDSVAKTFENGYAFLNTLDWYLPIARNFGHSDQDLCETVSSVTLGQMATYSGFYVAKESKVKEPFNYGLLLIMERGLNSRHYTALLKESTINCEAKNLRKSRATELGIGDVSTAFAVILLGLVLSFIFAIGEMLFCKYYCEI